MGPSQTCSSVYYGVIFAVVGSVRLLILIPRGWNRVLLWVQDLPACISDPKKAGLHFRNEMEIGPGGKQIQIEDPDGNPIELFEPAQRLD